MPAPNFIILAHGGAEAEPDHKDGVETAVATGMEALRGGKDALDACVAVIKSLEADERFNAGYGSDLRLDCQSVQMDAALIDSTNRFGAVSGLEAVKHPIVVARQIIDTPHVFLTHRGATDFARRLGHEHFDPRTEKARKSAHKLVQKLRRGEYEKSELEWSKDELRRCWNFGVAADLVIDAPPQDEDPEARAQGSDTVGAVVYDGSMYAAGASTGGAMGVLFGRVGDSCLPGCGIDASEHGCVTVSGAGEHIVRARVAARVLRRLEDGLDPQAACEEAIGWIDEEMPIAILAIDKRGRTGAAGRKEFPWARQVAPVHRATATSGGRGGATNR